MYCHVKTSLLRYIVLYFSLLGIQLLPVKVTNWKSVLTLSWNLSLNLSIYYAMIQLDPFTAKSYEIDYSKPMHILLFLDTLYLYPIAYFFYLTYFCLYGRRIVTLLDSEHFQQIYQNKGRLIKCMLVVMVLLGHVLFAYNSSGVIQISFNQLFEGITSLFCLYIMFFNWYLLLVMLHYFHYATLLGLQDVLRECKLNYSPSETIIQIQLYSNISKQFHQLMSFPLTIHLCLLTIDSVAVISLSEVIVTVEMYAQLAMTYAYILYQIYLGKKVQDTLEQIAWYLRNHHKNDQLFRTFEVATDSINPQSSDSLQIRLQEVEIYFPYFSSRLFYLCGLNYESAFSVALLIFNYSVLIIQTSR